MKLLLFGGTFDPPHWGHMSILQNAIDATQPGTVLVMPAGTPPHKEGGFTPAPLRLKMCECFRPLYGGLIVSDMEIRRGRPSYTWDTVQTLQQEYAGAEIALCIGSDMLLSFRTWRCYEKLLVACSLVVQNRCEEDVAPARAMAKSLTAEGGRVQFASGVVHPVSSTALRAAIAAGEDVSKLLPPPVPALVREYGLYTEGEPSA